MSDERFQSFCDDQKSSIPEQQLPGRDDVDLIIPEPRYPCDIDDERTLFRSMNSSQTKLLGSLGNSDNVIPVTSTDNFPDSGLITIDDETMFYSRRIEKGFFGIKSLYINQSNDPEVRATDSRRQTLWYLPVDINSRQTNSYLLRISIDNRPPLTIDVTGVEGDGNDSPSIQNNTARGFTIPQIVDRINEAFVTSEHYGSKYANVASFEAIRVTTWGSDDNREREYAVFSKILDIDDPNYIKDPNEDFFFAQCVLDQSAFDTIDECLTNFDDVETCVSGCSTLECLSGCLSNHPEAADWLDELRDADGNFTTSATFISGLELINENISGHKAICLSVEQECENFVYNWFGISGDVRNAEQANNNAIDPFFNSPAGFVSGSAEYPGYVDGANLVNGEVQFDETLDVDEDALNNVHFGPLKTEWVKGFIDFHEFNKNFRLPETIPFFATQTIDDEVSRINFAQNDGSWKWELEFRNINPKAPPYVYTLTISSPLGNTGVVKLLPVDDAIPFEDYIPDDEILNDNNAYGALGLSHFFNAKETLREDRNALTYSAFENVTRGIRRTVPGFHLDGSFVRGNVMADHHNNLTKALIEIQRFIGVENTEDQDSLDWRIRDLEALILESDDYDCPIVETAWEEIGSRTFRYEVVIDGFVEEAFIDFGDGEQITDLNEFSGEKRFEDGATIDPQVFVKTSNCTRVIPMITPEDVILPTRFVPCLPPTPTTINVTTPTTDTVEIPRFVFSTDFNDPDTEGFTIANLDDLTDDGECFQLVPCDA